MSNLLWLLLICVGVTVVGLGLYLLAVRLGLNVLDFGHRKTDRKRLQLRWSRLTAKRDRLQRELSDVEGNIRMTEMLLESRTPPRESR